MKNILNSNCKIIYYWYDHLVLRDNGDAKIVTEAIDNGDFKTFCKIKSKYPNKNNIIYFPDNAIIFYNDDIIGNIDITTELGFSFITDNDYECG